MSDGNVLIDEDFARLQLEIARCADDTVDRDGSRTAGCTDGDLIKARHPRSVEEGRRKNECICTRRPTNADISACRTRADGDLCPCTCRRRTRECPL